MRCGIASLVVASTRVNVDAKRVGERNRIRFQHDLTLITEVIRITVLAEPYSRNPIPVGRLTGTRSRGAEGLQEEATVHNLIRSCGCVSVRIHNLQRTDVGNRQFDRVSARSDTNRRCGQQSRKAVIADLGQVLPAIIQVVVIEVLRIDCIGSDRISAIDCVDRDGCRRIRDECKVLTINEQGDDVVERTSNELVVLFRGENEVHEQIIAGQINREFQHGSIGCGEPEFRIQIAITRTGGDVVTDLTTGGRTIAAVGTFCIDRQPCRQQHTRINSDGWQATTEQGG